MALDQGSGCGLIRGSGATGVAQGTTVQARAGCGGANRAAEAKAAVAQLGLGTGSGRGSVRARAWQPWELQAAAMQTFENQGSARGGRRKLI